MRYVPLTPTMALALALTLAMAMVGVSMAYFGQILPFSSPDEYQAMGEMVQGHLSMLKKGKVDGVTGMMRPKLGQILVQCFGCKIASRARNDMKLNSFEAEFRGGSF